MTELRNLADEKKSLVDNESGFGGINQSRTDSGIESD